MIFFKRKEQAKATNENQGIQFSTDTYTGKSDYIRHVPIEELLKTRNRIREYFGMNPVEDFYDG